MNLSTEGKSLLKGILIFSVVGIIVGFFLVPSSTAMVTTSVIDLPFELFMSNRLGFVLGVVLAALMSAVKVILLEKSVNKAMKMDDATKASLYMGAGYLPRMLLTVVVLAASVIFLGLFGIFGALVGTISLSVSAYMIKFFERRNKSNKSPKERSE
ncbi:MAG: hypothetical protein FWD97_09955 [Defluviitaleaceae bacterium]|nr:hypothetical protein [Defluviitaleaceae bacterium]